MINYEWVCFTMSDQPQSSTSDEIDDNEHEPEDLNENDYVEPDNAEASQEEEVHELRTDIHKFKLVLRNIQIYNVKAFDALTSDPFLYFTLGGDFKVEDLRHRYVSLI